MGEGIRQRSEKLVRLIHVSGLLNAAVDAAAGHDAVGGADPHQAAAL